MGDWLGRNGKLGVVGRRRGDRELGRARNAERSGCARRGAGETDEAED